MNEFASVDEALEALVASVYERGRYDECLQDGSPMPEVEVAAREWLRALGAYAQDRQGMATRRKALDELAGYAVMRYRLLRGDEGIQRMYGLSREEMKQYIRAAIGVYRIVLGHHQEKVLAHELALLMDEERNAGGKDGPA